DSGSSSASDEELDDDDDDDDEEEPDQQPHPGLATSAVSVPAVSFMPASPSLEGTPSTVTSASSHKSLSPIKTPSPDDPSGQVIYTMYYDVGIPSPVMSSIAPRRQSLGGKVSFVLGEESGSANQQPSDMSDAGLMDGPAVDSDKENMGRRKKRRGDESRRRGSSDGDMQDSGHALSKVPSAEESQSTRSGRRKHHHHHREHFRTEDLIMRRQKGSEVVLSENFKISPTESEEANMLYKADLDEMTSHRFEDQRGIRRHKIGRKKGAFQSVVHMGKSHHEKKPRPAKKYDHSPHEVFVELDELHFAGDDMMEWREKARWIKFEEDVEEGAERWGKPHVASLSFHSLLELRRGLERGTLLLDLEANDLTSIIHSVVENLVIRDLVEEEVKGKLLRTLLLKHKHVNGRSAFLRRNLSYVNLASMDSSAKRHQQHDKGLLSSISQSSFGSTFGLNKSPSQLSIIDKKRREGKAAAKLEMVKVDVDNNM
ncbi:unnamed protein product, partial [Candidula unifasciata]